MQPLMVFGLGALTIVLLFVALAVWRIGRVVSWQALAMTARATGSFEECVAFLRFCVLEGETGRRSLAPGGLRTAPKTGSRGEWRLG